MEWLTFIDKINKSLGHRVLQYQSNEPQTKPQQNINSYIRNIYFQSKKKNLILIREQKWIARVIRRDAF